jgi:hypothetical protein
LLAAIALLLVPVCALAGIGIRFPGVSIQIPLPRGERALPQFDLTGQWVSDSGGIYDITQTGRRIVWEAHSPDGVTWTHRFEGEVRGYVVDGEFADHPPGRLNNSGPVRFEYRDGRLYRTNRTRAFGDNVLSRGNGGTPPAQAYSPPQQPSAPAPQPARRSSSSSLSPSEIADLRGDVASPLHVWIGHAPDEIIDGRNFFAMSGVDEAMIRRVTQKVLKDRIAFFPVQHNFSVSFEEYGPDHHRKRIQDYLLPFCASREPACKPPYTFFDGAVVVSNAEGREPKYYMQIYDPNQDPHNRYCAIVSGQLSCRISPPMYRDNKMSVAVADTFGIIDTIQDGFESGSQPADLTDNVATSGKAANNKHLLACISYDASQAYTVLVDKYGNEHGGREYDAPTYTVVNVCSFPIHVIVEMGSKGNCPLYLKDAIGGMLTGNTRDYVLKPREGGPLGNCKGTITTLERS